MKKVTAVFAAFAFTAGMAATAFAGPPPSFYYGKEAPAKKAVKSGKSAGNADSWKGVEPVDTGAMQGKSMSGPSTGRIPPTSTHYNPQFPETRWQDLGGGGN